MLAPAAVLSGYLAIGAGALALLREPVAATAASGAVIMVAIVLLRILKPSWVSYGPAPRPGRATLRFGLAIALCAVLAFLAGQAMGLWLYFAVGSAGYDVSNQVRESAGIWLTLLLTLAVAPAGEEALFRGLLYPLLRRRVGVVIATLITAAGFGLLHGNIVQFAAVLPLGVLLALLYERTRALWPCMCMHLGFNLAAAVVPARALVPLANPVSAALLLLAFAAAAWMLHRQITGR
ncbi:CPBP family intramembrane glutamic endopeptidase [Arthrobacter sp. NPDC056691]|uniref:CPBP family intramembrane glutamic endopeptidase n=1 Tax=Arthrobacter sp. NPDC056691 TaxID=3345913 RepID=UPI00366E5BD5